MSKAGMGKFRVVKHPVTVIEPSDTQVQCNHHSFTWVNGVAIANRCNAYAQLWVHYVVTPECFCTIHAVKRGAIEPARGSHDEP